MKYNVLSIAIAMLLLGSCKDAPEADKAEAGTAQEVQTTSTGNNYTVDVNQSTFTWTGTKPTGRHEGTLKLKSGSLTADNGNITGGNFVADVATISPHDQDEEGNTKLGTHLKSADFFETDKYPEAKFEITSVAPVSADNKDVKLKDATHDITGNLTMKNITKSITFPAKIAMNGNSITADADFNIDRTQWGLNYQSDKSVQNKFIHHEVNLKVHLVANK
jgi:polyisoprenoid-binding protein YceI